jgi:hypothetical protein
LQTPLLNDVAKYFQDQHRQHANALAGAARVLGQSATNDPNAYLASNVVNPAIDSIKGESGSQQQTDTLKLAAGLEDVAAQTYAQAGGILTTPTLRSTIMSIGAIEAKHGSLLAFVMSNQVVPFPFEPTSGAAPKDAYITPGNPVPSTSTPGTLASLPGGTTPSASPAANAK